MRRKDVGPSQWVEIRHKGCSSLWPVLAAENVMVSLSLSLSLSLSPLQEWRAPMLEDLAELFHLRHENSLRMSELKSTSKSSALMNTNIIGCTTVSAAKQRALLEMVAPEVVLVEEAGEIFEAQVLTNINTNCKQLILIGDHKQLRPKVTKPRCLENTKKE